MIGDAAHKAGLDALVIEEFERRRYGVRKAAAEEGARRCPARRRDAAAPPRSRREKKGPAQDDGACSIPISAASPRWKRKTGRPARHATARASG